jgi:hypothetical protein
MILIQLSSTKVIKYFFSSDILMANIVKMTSGTFSPVEKFIDMFGQGKRSIQTLPV